MVQENSLNELSKEALIEARVCLIDAALAAIDAKPEKSIDNTTVDPHNNTVNVNPTE